MMNLMVQSGRWQPDALPAKAVWEVCAVHFPQLKGGEVALVLSDDAAVRGLNHDFRAKDKPTNVLSFPSDAEGELGDVIMAEETIAREAEEQGKSFEDHFAHLWLHGLLHLLGYDHQSDEEASEMESLEMKLLGELGIANPYETR